MESVAPTLDLVLSLRSSLENGDSLAQAIRDFCAQTESRELKNQLLLYLSRIQSGLDAEKLLPEQMSNYRRIVFQVIGRGLEGAAILPSLQEVQKEIFERCEIDLESFAATLPFKMMVPLLFFLFPAFAMLFLGPLLAALMRDLS